jgi:hypothetical protein
LKAAFTPALARVFNTHFSPQHLRPFRFKEIANIAHVVNTINFGGQVIFAEN